MILNAFYHVVIYNLRYVELGAYIHPDNVDELETIEFEMLRNRFSTNSFGVTLAPTSDCNFRCIYCYEKNVLNSSYMTAEVQDSIVQLLKERVKTINHFGVTWYGGEPLLAFDIIKSLTQQFQELCDENNINYSAGMITNGYLLTKDIAKEFQELNINFLQITLDGMPNTHNERRPLHNGEPTFNKIISNIEECYEYLPTVSLRINIDKTNMNAGEYILCLLQEKGLTKKVKPYFGKVSNDNECYINSTCLNTLDFSKIDLDFQKTLYDLEICEDIPKYPQRKATFCGADNISSLVINANGDIYKCWSDIGNRERVVGNLVGEPIEHTHTLMDYMLFNPTKNSNCRKCKLLPICMGGCPYRRLNNEKDNCSIYKYILNECIVNATSVIVRQRELAEKETAIAKD